MVFYTGCWGAIAVAAGLTHIFSLVWWRGLYSPVYSLRACKSFTSHAAYMCAHDAITKSRKKSNEEIIKRIKYTHPLRACERVRDTEREKGGRGKWCARFNWPSSKFTSLNKVNVSALVFILPPPACVLLVMASTSVLKPQSIEMSEKWFYHVRIANVYVCVCVTISLI